MSKIYIAASYPRKKQAVLLAKKMRSEGHIIVSQWHDLDEGYDKMMGMEDRAERDFQNIKECDLFIEFTGDNLSHGGRHAEFGVALALGKEIKILGPREHVLHYLVEK